LDEVGVDLFFVLSGFLIGGHLIRSPLLNNKYKLSKYFVARALRILPAYYFVLFVVAFGLVPMYEIDQDLMGFRLVYHILFLQDYFPSDIVSAFWSLGVEEKFYIFAPLLIGVSASLSKPLHRYGSLLCLMLVPTLFRCIAFVKYPEVTDYESFFPIFRSPFHVSFDGMIGGLICAHLYQDWRSEKHSIPNWLPNTAYWLGVTLLCFHLIPFNLLGEITQYDKTIEQLIISISFSLVLLGILFGTRQRKILRSVAGLFFARISYTLYLSHMPLIAWCYTYFYLPYEQSGLALYTYLAVYFTLSIFVACAIHFAIEKPFLLMKTRMADSG